MNIILAEYRGFCYGVKRAVELACAATEKSSPIHTLGPIIHNPQMVERLKHQGVGVADSLNDMATGTVVIRSHGVGPNIYEQIKEKNLELVDATCPHVKKAQQEAAALEAAGYQVVIIGEREHPEVKSIFEWTQENAVILGNTAEAAAWQPTKKVGVVSQTTFSSEQFQAICDILAAKCPELVTKRTICTATDQRQQAALAAAAKVEVMLVIGGKNSANTSRLAELCRESGRLTYHIETAAELQKEWLAGVHTVGITAGASTPDWIIEEVTSKVEELDQMVNEAVANVKVGEVIQGKVVSATKDEVFVDIGYKAEGVVSRVDLAFPTPEDAAAVAAVGDVISVYVVALDTDEKPVVLSKLLADKQGAWSALKDALEQNKNVEVQVTEVVKGGLVGAFSGTRVFIPASQLSLRYVEDLAGYVGQTLEARPIEIDETKNKAVLSRRVVLQEERRLKEEAVYDGLVVGSVIEGTVSRLASFGAFIDVGDGVDGLVHISDLSWERVASPDEVVSVGDTVSVKVLKVDKEAKRISLGLKEVQRDPWYDKAAAFVPGKIVEGTVTKLTAFGAFVAIGSGLEGLVHLSEMADHHVVKAEEVVEKGQKVKVKVLSVDENKKKIALSLKAAQEELERKEFQSYLGDQDGLHVTLGDKFKDLFKGLK